MEYHSLRYRLARIPHVWSLDNEEHTIGSIQSLQRFLFKEIYDNQRLPKDSSSDQTSSYDVPYHQSLFHFFLYYTYSPKIPFVVSTEQCLFFGSFYGRNHSSLELSVPLFYKSSIMVRGMETLLNDSLFAHLLKEAKVKQIILRDVSEEVILLIRSSENCSITLRSLKEIQYQTYDVNKTLRKTGKEFANLRWHLNKFQKDNHIIQCVSLSDHVKPVIHLIGSWKRAAIKQRGFSYVNINSDKLAARLFSKNNDMCLGNEQLNTCSLTIDDCASQVLLVDGKVASFHAGYPLGIFKKQPVFAHAIGITDISIPHLAEYAQYEFWKEIQKKGYHYVNDGPSWKMSLETYKKKFRPISKKRYYYATIDIDI
ncbi:MAG: hypothetical protein QCI00_07150 [Candidatus Thermoplasmatota archaeon]|nr:hypothetical protein [Candidatus Thermoplasmatota archaeon]